MYLVYLRLGTDAKPIMVPIKYRIQNDDDVKSKEERELSFQIIFFLFPLTSMIGRTVHCIVHGRKYNISWCFLWSLSRFFIWIPHWIVHLWSGLCLHVILLDFILQVRPINNIMIITIIITMMMYSVHKRAREKSVI